MNKKILTSEHLMWYDKAANNFNEALPLGNGRLGGMVYADVSSDRISLNEETLWSGFRKIPKSENYPKTYKKAKELMDKGEIDAAQKLLEDKFGDFLVQMYMPFGNLKIDSVNYGKVTNYKRSLDLSRAIQTLSYKAGGVNFKREYFASNPHDVLVVNLTADKKGKINFTATLECVLNATFKEEKDTVLCEGAMPTAVAEYNDAYRDLDHIVYGTNNNTIRFSSAMSVTTVGGTAEYKGNCITVKNADSATLYISIRTNFKAFDIAPDAVSNGHTALCVSDVKTAMRAGYQKVLSDSVNDYKNLYDACEISFYGNSRGKLPTDRRIKKLEKRKDNSLYALLFNFGRYLAISSSRVGTQPANLQGIWNEKLLPPWNSNYTLNINTEMNYWPILRCGLDDCFEPFVKFVEELAVSGTQTAKTYYGLENCWVCHHSTDIWRITHPATNRITNNCQWGFWNLASGWLCNMLFDKYRYSGDLDYLKRIYPTINGAAEFYKQLLVEEDGMLILSPSTSPENNYLDKNGNEHALDKYTAMSQEIIYELFSYVSKAQDILGIDNEYKDLLPKIKMPTVGKDGLLKEWSEEYPVWDLHHRHVSHLYGLFPANLFDKKQRAAARKTLIQRGDNGTGWSLAWKINLWARLRNGEHALKLLNNQLKLVPSENDSTNFSGGSYQNLLCAHPPFQIDGNFGAVSGIIEMLVTTDKKGNAVLLPACPKSWKKGYVKNIRLPKNQSVSFSFKNGTVKFI